MSAVLHAVLPIGPPVAKASDDLRRAHLLIRSLRRFFDSRDRLDLFVVTPDAHLGRVRAGLEELSGGHIRLRFLSDEEIVPQLKARDRPRTGWVIQQLIKMAFPRFTDADFCMTFDCDVIAVQAMSVADLVPDGRALYLKFQTESPLWRAWIEASSQLLGIEPRLDAPTLGPTPNIYARPLMIDVHERLAQRFNCDWIDAILRAPVPGRCTEMQMYHAAAVDSGKLEAYHSICGKDVPRYLHRFEGGIWRKEDIETWDPAKAFAPKPNPYCFIVCNTYTGVTAERIDSAVTPYLR